MRLNGIFTGEALNGIPIAYTVITDINDLVEMEKTQSITYNNIFGENRTGCGIVRGE